MPKALTLASKVECGHQGALTLTSNGKLKVNGSAVVTNVGPGISGCVTQDSNSSNKCRNASPAGGIAGKLKVQGSPVILDTVGGSTDGNPKGTVTATANQNKLTAS
jgi:hypothetical protein